MTSVIIFGSLAFFCTKRKRKQGLTTVALKPPAVDRSLKPKSCLKKVIVESLLDRAEIEEAEDGSESSSEDSSPTSSDLEKTMEEAKISFNNDVTVKIDEPYLYDYPINEYPYKYGN